MTAPLRIPFASQEDQPGLVMPDQDLAAPFRDPQAPGIRSPLRARALRAFTLAFPMAVTLLIGWAGLGWFALDGHLTVAEGALVGVTVFAFYWVALSVATATLGLFWRPHPQATALHGLRIAILLPMFGEPADEVIGNAAILLKALHGKSRHKFALHVLSDTRDPDKAMIEEEMVTALQRRYPQLLMQYRRRTANTDYKSGNIRDWIQTRSSALDAMLILDADSIMGAATVLRMADTMAISRGLGLIQTVPRVLPGVTLWQRMQSFASEVYGINLGRGFAVWSGTEGNFLGHNALVRTAAFAASAGLPHLPGKAPRGGVILSHDFVEAALIRRAGWGVRMLPEAAESFEDTPATLIGYLRRDRRWCQGNMQHVRLLATPGLHPVSRFHLLQGAMAYLASVWWLILLVLWAVPGRDGTLPNFFASSPIMPNWPNLPPVTQAALMVIVTLMLLGPKLLGVAAHLRDRRLTLGKAPAFFASVSMEIALSILIAPALMVHQVRAVLRTLMGFDGGWAPHLKGRPTLPILVRFHLIETLLGFGLLGLAAFGELTPWLLPVASCLALTIPLSWIVQREIGASWLLRPLPER
jgi:membrane glycosyltransferase